MSDGLHANPVMQEYIEKTPLYFLLHKAVLIHTKLFFLKQNLKGRVFLTTSSPIVLNFSIVDGNNSQVMKSLDVYRLVV